MRIALFPLCSFLVLAVTGPGRSDHLSRIPPRERRLERPPGRPK